MPSAVYPALQNAVLHCIDDNEDVLECDKSFRESFGYTVLTAPSGGNGLCNFAFGLRGSFVLPCWLSNNLTSL